MPRHTPKHESTSEAITESTPDAVEESKPKIKCPPEEFIRAWQTSDSIAEVVDKLKRYDMSKNSIQARAANYRQDKKDKKGKLLQSGIPLKSFSGRPRINYAKLSQFAEQCLKEYEDAKKT